MRVSASSVTSAQINRAVKALEDAGHPVRAARLYPDGSIALLTDVHAEALPEAVLGSWVDLAGGEEAHRA